MLLYAIWAYGQAGEREHARHNKRDRTGNDAGVSGPRSNTGYSESDGSLRREMDRLS
jgi:hypothetical protein